MPPPATCFKLTVRSAAEAARLIREKFGDNARVLSVNSVEPTGMSKLWSGPRLEVIVQPFTPAPEIVAEPEREEMPATLAETPARSEAPARFAPPSFDLRTLLLRAGLSETLLARLTQSREWAGLESQPLHRGLVAVGRQLGQLAGADHVAAPLARAAFIGPSGAGKTTALCKWLGLETFRRARTGHVVTAEFDRPNATGALPVYCEALGVPVAHYPAGTQPATEGGFVYFDLPGFSLRAGAANEALRKFLNAESIEQRVLVLNAAYDAGVLRAALAAGRELGATHLVLTHLDEIPRWGRLWDLVIDSGLEPLLLATGSSLTTECEDDVLDALTRRTLPPATDRASADEAHGRAA
jgi:flagellar biosynthesis protein FlhF